MVFNNFVKNPKGGRTSIEYAITVTMAKELAMVENNQKGTFRSVFFVLELLNCGIIDGKSVETLFRKRNTASMCIFMP